MQERIKNLANGLFDRWRNLAKGQKIRLVSVLVMLLAVTGITVYIVSRPKMFVLLSNKDLPTISQVEAALTQQGIPSEVSTDWSSIKIREADRVAAQSYLSLNEIPNTQGINFDDLMSGNQLTSSDTVTKEALKKIKETELENGLTTMNGIEAANATLTLADDTTYFWEPTQQSKASIVLTVTKALDSAQREAIANYVKTSVASLELENIQIIDQNSNTVYSGVSESEEGGYSKKSELEAAKKTELDRQINAALSNLYNKVETIYTLEFDFDEQSTESVQYAAAVDGTNTGILSRSITEQSSVTNGDAGAVPGTAANNQQQIPNVQAGNNTNTDASQKSADQTYLVDEVKTKVTKNTGKFLPAESSLAIVAFQDKIYEEDYVKQNNLLPEGTTWEQFKEANNGTTVQLPTDTTLLANLILGTKIDNLSLTVYERTFCYDAQPAQIKIEQIIILVILAILILLLAYGLIRNSQPDEITEIEPELSVEDLLVSTKLEETEDLSEIERMKNLEVKESETKRQIEKFVNEKPEAVAQLLRNWLSDEWE